MDLIKNEIVKGIVESYGHDGEGVIKIDGFPIFVKGAILGEELNVKILKANKTHAFGKIEEIITQSENRIESDCEVSNRCGGCELRHMNRKEELNFKEKMVLQTIERIGKVDISKVEYKGIKTGENENHYRNKIQIPIKKVDGKVVAGFYESRSHNIIEMGDCKLQFSGSKRIIDRTIEFINKYNIPVYDERDEKSNGVRHIMLRKGFTSGEIMVVLVSKWEIKFLKEYVQMISGIDGVSTIIINYNNKKTNVVLGEKSQVLFGSGHIYDTIGDFKFKISEKSFFQVNPEVTNLLYNSAIETSNIQKEDKVIDAYCGAGTISMFLSKKCEKVYGIDIVKEAIEDGKQNIAINGVKNIELICSDVVDTLPQIIDKGAKVIVLDPPRKGADEEIINQIGKSKIEKIVYISCNPGTLARDIARLKDFNFEIKTLETFDMFPGTKHVESLALISRVK